MRRIALTLLASTLLLACGDATGPDPFFGTYDLATVGGESLPAVLLEVVGRTVEVTAGTLQVTESDRFTFSITVRVTDEGLTPEIATTTVNGTYTRSGSSITLTGDDGVTGLGGTITGQLSESTITWTDDGVTFVFRKT